MTHSIAPKPVVKEPFRIRVGGPGCKQPYEAAILNISAMSFGALGPHAIEALNRGAKLGGFYHDTGEGGISRYHRNHGGDIVWEMGTGYFGSRNPKGTFNPDRFAEQAQTDQMRMIEIKLSQGAKPGHGGILPGAKVSPEISEARGDVLGVDCISPSRHSAFSTPVEMMEFIAKLRELSGGKPIGFKLCIGHPTEVFALIKAMLKTGIKPDFIVVDGEEGGTGAAPAEFSDHLGMPLREGLLLVRNALVGANLRRENRLAAGGKIVSGFPSRPTWRWAPTGATRPAPSCSRWAACSRCAATPTAVPQVSPPTIRCCSGGSWWRSRRSAWRIPASHRRGAGGAGGRGRIAASAGSDAAPYLASAQSDRGAHPRPDLHFPRAWRAACRARIGNWL